MTSPTNTFLFISNPHTAEHHSKDKDKSVYLLFHEKSFVKKAVKLSPIAIRWRFVAQAALRILIDFSLKKSVQHYVRKELHGIRACLLDKVDVDDTHESLSRLSDKIWFKTALESGSTQCWQVYGPCQSSLHRSTIHD